MLRRRLGRSNNAWSRRGVTRLELEQQGHDLLDRQVMPMELFVFLCGGAILSAVLFGLFLWGQYVPQLGVRAVGPVGGGARTRRAPR